MDSKSRRVEHDFQKRVTDHLRKEGFNCIAQPMSSFPNILAWRPFLNSDGDTLAINVVSNISGTITTKMVLPFYISFIECKIDKKLTKKEKEAAKLTLKEGRCNTFLVAHRKDKELLFQEITLEDEKIVTTSIEKQLPSYIG